MAWKKGQSGNPKGRPPLSRDVKVLAKKYTKRAVQVLVEVMDDRAAPCASRVSAAQTILDRGWGKAPLDLKVQTTAETRIVALIQALDASKPAPRVIDLEPNDIKHLGASSVDDGSYTRVATAQALDIIEVAHPILGQAAPRLAEPEAPAPIARVPSPPDQGP